MTTPSDKIIQVSGFGVEKTMNTQCNYMLVALTESGRVLMSTGDQRWCDVSPVEINEFTTAAEDAGLEVVSMTTNRGRYRPGKGGRHHGAIQVLHRSE